MKRSIFYLIVLLSPSFCPAGYSQLLSQQGEARYKIGLPEHNTIFFDAKLEFTGSKSTFTYMQNTKARWRVIEDSKHDGGFAEAVVLTDTIGYVIIHDLRQPHLLVREFCIVNRPVIYKDTVRIDWEITEERGVIQGVPCILAKTRFRGRNYEAWFAPDVPVPFGPWKFSGLPGLIVEVKSDTETVAIQLKSLNLKAEPKSMNPENITGESVLRKDFFLCKDKEQEKTEEQARAKVAQMRARSPGLTITYTPSKEVRAGAELEFEETH